MAADLGFPQFNLHGKSGKEECACSRQGEYDLFYRPLSGSCKTLYSDFLINTRWGKVFLHLFEKLLGSIL
jgi:hypothetical protein